MYVPNRAGGVLCRRLEDLTVLDNLLDLEGGKRYRDGKEDRSVSELETGADPTTETEDHAAGVRLGLVAGSLHEAVGVEGERIRVGLGVVEHAPDVRDDDRAFGEVVTGVDVVLDETVRDGCVRIWLSAGVMAIERRRTRTKRGDVVPAEDLKIDSVQVGKAVAVRGRRETIGTNDTLNLIDSLRLDLRVEGHREEECVNRRDSLRAQTHECGLRYGSYTDAYRVGTTGVERRSRVLDESIALRSNLALKKIRCEVRNVSTGGLRKVKRNAVKSAFRHPAKQGSARTIRCFTKS